MTKILIMLQRLAGGGGLARATARGILKGVMVKGSQTYGGAQNELREREREILKGWRWGGG